MIYSEVLRFIFGTILLYYCSNALIDSASSLAKKYNISKMIIGMTLVAFGTSLPELIVSIVASLKGEIDLVIGNILGSNIANIGLVLGITSLFYKIFCDFKTIRFDALFLVITSTIFTFILYCNKFENSYAIILFIILFIYMYIFIKLNKINNEETVHSQFSINNNGKLLLLIIFGIAGLSIGSNILISAAINIAQYFNISSMVIGITAVALGTSLPELATSLNAAKKNESGLLLGNIFGSNIINIVFVFSISLLVNQSHPKVTNYSFELFLFLFLTVLLLLSLRFGKIFRFIGLLFLITYSYFIFYIFTTL